MSYKTILVHLDKKSIAEHRVRIAANLAIAEDACLIGVAMIGISTLTFQQAHIDEKDPVLASHLKFLHDRAAVLSGNSRRRSREWMRLLMRGESWTEKPIRESVCWDVSLI